MECGAFTAIRFHPWWGLKPRPSYHMSDALPTKLPLHTLAESHIDHPKSSQKLNKCLKNVNM